MSGVERTQSDVRIDEDESDEEREPIGNKSEDINVEKQSDDENVKLALASFFSDPQLQGEVDDDRQNRLNVEDIPERVRPILLDKWRRLRSNLDSSRSRGPVDPNRGGAGRYCNNNISWSKPRYIYNLIVPIFDFQSNAVFYLTIISSSEYYQNMEEKLASVEEALKAKTMESEEEAKNLEELHTSSAENRQKLLEIEQENER